MAATTTPSISWLLSRLEAELPKITFVENQHFAWSPDKQQVFYDPKDKDGIWQLLHEAGHAICDHQGYQRDIELLGYEVDAWSAAESLAKRLEITIPDEVIDDHLDTYRDWLHQRSQCVSCSQTGIQINYNTYRCLHCPTKWRVNDGRQCGLRRYRTN